MQKPKILSSISMGVTVIVSNCINDFIEKIGKISIFDELFLYIPDAHDRALTFDI